MHDVLTKQIAVRGDPSRCDYIIAARESSPAITIRHHRSDPFVHLALRQTHTNAHKRTRTRTQSDYPFRPFVPFARSCRRVAVAAAAALSALPTLDINTDTRVRICMLAGFALRERAHIAARLGAFGCTYTYTRLCAYARTFNPRLVYVLRNARPVSTVSRDNDEGDEEVVDGGNVCTLRKEEDARQRGKREKEKR